MHTQMIDTFVLLLLFSRFPEEREMSRPRAKGRREMDAKVRKWDALLKQQDIEQNIF